MVGVLSCAPSYDACLVWYTLFYAMAEFSAKTISNALETRICFLTKSAFENSQVTTMFPLIGQLYIDLFCKLLHLTVKTEQHIDH